MKHKYRYCLKEDYTLWYDLNQLFYKSNLFYIQLEWGEIYRDKIIVYKNYAWNGASGPVWQGKLITKEQYVGLALPVLQEESEAIRDTTVGTLIHDFMYQFLKEISEHTGLSLSEARMVSDIIFMDILIKFDFYLYRLYYFGVRVFGKLWIRIGDMLK